MTAKVQVQWIADEGSTLHMVEYEANGEPIVVPVPAGSLLWLNVFDDGGPIYKANWPCAVGLKRTLYVWAGEVVVT